MTGADYGRGNADAWVGFLDEETVLRSSDHDGMVLYLDSGSLLFADGFETGDSTMWASSTP